MKELKAKEKKKNHSNKNVDKFNIRDFNYWLLVILSWAAWLVLIIFIFIGSAFALAGSWWVIMEAYYFMWWAIIILLSIKYLAYKLIKETKSDKVQYLYSIAMLMLVWIILLLIYNYL